MTDAKLVAALGTYWPEPMLQELLTSFDVSRQPRLDSDGYSGFLHNHARGIELTFKPPGLLDVPRRSYPENAVVLSNIRFYGQRSEKFSAYTERLPFDLRFGTYREAIIAQLGPADSEAADIGSLRWDRDRYSLFARVSGAGILDRVALQTPMVRTNRPGF